MKRLNLGVKFRENDTIGNATVHQCIAQRVGKGTKYEHEYAVHIPERIYNNLTEDMWGRLWRSMWE